MNDEYPTGYVLPVIRAVCVRQLSGGIPRKFSILLLTLGAAMLMGLRHWAVIPVVLGLLLGLKEVYRHDEYALEILLMHLRRASRLEV
jgi:type IV secretory pathway TrbD component